MKKHYDCNNCDNSSCRGDKATNLNNVIKQLPCKGYKIPTPMKTPLLMVAMERKNCATVINRLFKQFDISFSESNAYPYFRLTLGDDSSWEEV